MNGIFHHHIVFCISKGPGYLYQLSGVLPKQTICEMNALQVKVYIQQWFHEEHGAKYV